MLVIGHKIESMNTEGETGEWRPENLGKETGDLLAEAHGEECYGVYPREFFWGFVLNDATELGTRAERDSGRHVVS